MITKEDLRDWFKRGVKKNYTHMIIVCDHFDYSDYPVYVGKHQNVRLIENEYDHKEMQSVMEVYNLKLDMEKQLNEHRSFNY